MPAKKAARVDQSALEKAALSSDDSDCEEDDGDFSANETEEEEEDDDEEGEEEEDFAKQDEKATDKKRKVVETFLNNALGRRVPDADESDTCDKETEDDEDPQEQGDKVLAEGEYYVQAVWRLNNGKVFVHWFGFDQMDEMTIEPMAPQFRKLLRTQTQDLLANYPWSTGEGAVWIQNEYREHSLDSIKALYKNKVKK